MSRWYRAYEGTVTDAKLGEVALVAECSRSVAIATWHCLLESAASVNDGGKFDATPRRVAVILGESPRVIEAAMAEMAALGMISDNTITAWSKRQYESDNSTERSRKHRERKRNSDATPMQRCATPPETETETETEELAPNGACPTRVGPEPAAEADLLDGDAPAEPAEDPNALLPEHVVEEWNKLAGRLTKPRVRDITPERRQLLKARIAQYGLDDFLTVFGKIEGSAFLRGDKDWQGATFDWVFKKANFQKILEGNYDR